MKPRILIVDDESEVADSLAQILDKEGYKVITAGDDAEAMYYYDEFRPDLIILDIRFGFDERMGLDILKEIRMLKDDKSIPVIMLTGLGEDELEPRSFEYEATDFARKSISTKALLARVKARLPRAMREPYMDDRLKIDLGNCSAKVKRDGEWQEVHLEPMECKVLKKLMSDPGRVITREALENLFHNTNNPANSLNRCISKLRKKLEPDPHDPQYIVTKRGVGYRFKYFR